MVGESVSVRMFVTEGVTGPRSFEMEIEPTLLKLNNRTIAKLATALQLVQY